MSSSFAPRATPLTLAEPDPTKHVKYTLGMVLGVDDFTQEFAYLDGRDRWLARDLHGYGTATGLRVGVEIENGAPQVVVTPGTAVSPRGRLIRVAPAQCADLNLWLAARHEELRQRIGNAPSNRALLRLYLVLSYRDCATDMVPIPGEPCRSQDETLAPSRLADDFRLELRYGPPDQREEDALRDFVDWLGQVVITDTPGSTSTLEDFQKAIRDAARIPSSPPSPLDFFYGSPPGTLRIHSSMAREFMRAAFRLWATELRPLWHEMRGDRGEVLQTSVAVEDDGVLLAELSVPLARATANTIWQVQQPPQVEVHEERRPYLVHLRMLQEMVVSGRIAGAGGASSGGAAIPPAATVTAATSYDLQPNAGQRFDYARADHTHGTPPAPVLAGDVTGAVSTTKVVKIQNVAVDATLPTTGQLLGFDAGLNRWKPITPAAPPAPVLAGDVTGAAGSTTVVKIQNRDVLQTAPAEGQVLTFTGGKWQPATPTGGGATGPKPATTVVAETNSGQSSNVGASVDYARADHTHGTPPAPTLNGDVTGAVGASKVVKIQNVAIDATLPTAGQLLGFDAGLNRWRPVPPPPPQITQTNAVARATSLGYAIVAAGLIPAAKGATGNSYNNLRVTGVGDGVVTMIFDGYKQPPATGGEQQYIVKVLPVLPGGTSLNLTVMFGSFGDSATGFTLIVNDAGRGVPLATLNTLSFMVEVSQFDLKAFTTTKTKETKETESKAIKDTEKGIKETETEVSKFADAPSAAPRAQAAGPEASDVDATSAGRAFIVEEERPEVGRAAFDLADKQDDKLPETGTTGKQAEAFN